MGGLRESHRNMNNIRHSSCASRVFNLLDLTSALVGKESPAGVRASVQPTGIEPFFAHSALNATIFLKHRLRADERSLFARHRSAATKIFLPFNHEDLSDGGRFAFIGERRWQQTCLDLFGLDPHHDDPNTHRDLTILETLDELPSLDPFILRQRLQMEGITPALDYFRLPDADYDAINAGVEREFLGLARPELRQAYRSRHGLGWIVRMMWDCRDPVVIEPLMEILGVSEDELGEVMFAWKGFIYYKSLLPTLARNWVKVRQQIATARILGSTWNYRGEDLGGLRERALARIQHELTTALDTVRLYDQAYRDGLLDHREPGVLRAFLARAPELFPQLANAIAAVHHATTFWRYRFGDPATLGCPAEELRDILTDFSDGLGAASNPRPVLPRLAPSATV